MWCLEGPCLVHTITGDLLRALEGPELCQRPRLISVSSEGHCIIYYERGRFCNFSINGKLLAQMEVNDSTRVNLMDFIQVTLACRHISRLVVFLSTGHLAEQRWAELSDRRG